MDFLGLSLCGELLEPPAAGKWKIGFIGDSLPAASITCAE